VNQDETILEAALPLQRFIDHTYTHLIARVRKAGRDVFVYDPAGTLLRRIDVPERPLQWTMLP